MSCEIDNQTAKPLAASFVLCPALEEIMLSWNLLGDEAAAELAQVLPRMGRLKRVEYEGHIWRGHKGERRAKGRPVSWGKTKRPWGQGPASQEALLDIHTPVPSQPLSLNLQPSCRTAVC